MWHAIRLAAIVWNGTCVSLIAIELVMTGNLHVDAAPAHNTDALTVVVFLLGSAASLGLALKAQVKTISVKGHSA